MVGQVLEALAAQKEVVENGATTNCRINRTN